MHFSQPRKSSAMKERLRGLRGERKKLLLRPDTITRNLRLKEKEILIKHYQDKIEEAL